MSIFSLHAASLDEVASVLVAWFDDEVDADELRRRFASVNLAVGAVAHFHGARAEVEAAWDRLLARSRSKCPFQDLVVGAHARCELSELFPYTSLGGLCFSRCTGYPYTRDDPAITPPGGLFDERLFVGVLEAGDAELEQAREE